MVPEVRGLCRRPVPGEIGRRGDKDPRIVRQAPRLQRGIRQRGAAERQVERSLDEIEGRIRQPQIELQMRIAVEEVGDQRCDILDREGRRGGKAQRARDGRVAPPQRGETRILLGEPPRPEA